MSCDDEIGGARGTCGEEQKCIQYFGGGKTDGKNHLEDPGIDGRIILRRIFRKWYVGAWTE